jgi:ferric-dicitrate binding protein FerR (iron transport regulator)
MTPEVRLELEQLVSALCDGALDDAQHARLQELMGADAECRRHYLRYIDLHARLLLHPSHQGPSPLALPGQISNAQRPTPSARTSRSSPPYARYAVIAVASLFVSLMLQWLWRVTHPEAFIPDPPDPVATLAQSHDCKWKGLNGAIAPGMRLRPGELGLMRGLARIHFDSGSDLVIEGPTTIRLESTTAATLINGKLVFHSDDTTPPFELHTPSASLVELGTEYAVSVNSDAEEVHVFEGEVQRTPQAPTGRTEPHHLSTGESRRFPRSGASSEPAVLDPTCFIRQMPDAAAPSPNPASGLFAHESFDYSDADSLMKGTATGGIGFEGAWKPVFPLPPPRPIHKTHSSLNIRDGLAREGLTSAGGCFDAAGNVRYLRRLTTPINLGEDGVYYLSFLFRRHGPAADSINAFAIVLRPTDAPAMDREDFSRRLNIGIGAMNQLYTHLHGICTRTPLPLSYGETYLLVAKIVAGNSRPCQIMVRIYGADEPVSLREPSDWTSTSQPFPSDVNFHWLEIAVNSKRRQQIDEIRIGTTWCAVTTSAPAK